MTIGIRNSYEKCSKNRPGILGFIWSGHDGILHLSYGANFILFILVFSQSNFLDSIERWFFHESGYSHTHVIHSCDSP